MRKFLSFWLCTILLMTGFVHHSAAQGYLKANGKQIVMEDGKPIILRGMGLGGWMLQEGYMFKLSNLGQQYRIKEKISDVVGSTKANEFYEQWLLHHTTRTDIDSLASWGFNSVRLPMHYNLYTLPVEEEPIAGQNTWLEKGFALTDSLLAWCRANRLYLILDLHAAPGGQGNDLPISDRNPAKPSLWQSEANQQKTIALWRKLAERYAAEPWIGGYDLINEPNWGFEDAKDFRGTAEKTNVPLRKLMMDITAAIREVDKRHLIIIEGNGFGNNYNGILPAWDNNMALSFHKYGNFNTGDAIRSFLKLREAHNIPIWLGESGENSNNWFTHAIDLAERNGIGWAWWQGKKMGVNNPFEIKQPRGYNALLDYWSGKGSKPTPEAAWATLQELLQNIRIANNSYHPDVIDAMIRQVQTEPSTLPFKSHVIMNESTLLAADYDLGPQGTAYYDKDTASYQYTPGVKTVGNRGRAYRNDGVDIENNAESLTVFSIEDEEWLQYTVQVPKSGIYNISLYAKADSTVGEVSIVANGKALTPTIVVHPTKGDGWLWTKPVALPLSIGTHRIRLLAVKGGYRLRQLRFSLKQ